MGNNCNCETNETKAVGIIANLNGENNTSSARVEFQIDELHFNGIELKGLKGHVGYRVTDNCVRTEADMTGKIFDRLITKFGDSLVEGIKASTEATRARIVRADKEFEADHKYDEAREKRAQEDHAAEMKLKETHAQYHEAQIKVQEAELEKIKKNG